MGVGQIVSCAKPFVSTLTLLAQPPSEPQPYNHNHNHKAAPGSRVRVEGLGL